MPLDPYQQKILQGIRIDEQDRGITLFTYSSTGAGFNADDIYGRRIGWTESISFFSGSVAWPRRIERVGMEGGWVPDSDATITCSRDYLGPLGTGSGFKERFNHIIIDNVKFKPQRIVDCIETQEIVVYCERLE